MQTYAAESGGKSLDAVANQSMEALLGGCCKKKGIGASKDATSRCGRVIHQHTERTESMANIALDCSLGRFAWLQIFDVDPRPLLTVAT